MRIAAIYDIHGNLPALEAVLREIEAEQVDLIVVGGDVAAGPLPAQTVDRLRELGPRACFVRGNADRHMVAAYDGAPPDPDDPEQVVELTRWASGQLSREQRDFMAGFVERAVFQVDGLGEVLFCHATPRDDEELFTVLTPEPRMREIFAAVEQPVVVCGHTHMQAERSVPTDAGQTRVANAGSVGMPYAEPGAYWLLLGPDVQFRRTRYDLEAAAALIRASGYPQAEDFAANNVLRPHSAAEALAVFEPNAGKGTEDHHGDTAGTQA